MNIMKEWLSQNRKSVQLEDLLVTFEDAIEHGVSVKAGNVVPVTFSLVANVRKLPNLNEQIYK